MKHYATFRGYIVTTNPDGSIPLNAKVAGAVAPDYPLNAEALIAQANAAHDLFTALYGVTHVIANRSTDPTYAHQLSNLLPSLLAAVNKAKEVAP